MKKKSTHKSKTKYKPKAKQTSSLDAATIQTIRDQVIRELNDKKQQDEEAQRKIKIAAEAAHVDYLKQMHASTEPWVEVQSWTDTSQGVKVELDWNDAFVAYLRANGYAGVDEDQIVQKYIAILTQHVTDGMQGKQESELE